MRSSALRKEEFFEETTQTLVKARVKAVAPESWESRRLSIAREAEAACHLSGNNNCPDFEEFLSNYGKSAASDFA